MTQLSIPTLVAETKDLLLSVKRNYLAISVNVFKMHEAWTGTVDGWVDFYEQELELSKSQVSKMRQVGAFVLSNGLLNKTEVSYEKLYLSISRNKDKDPEYILAEAQTWHNDDYKSQAKDDCTTPDFHLVCTNCWSSKEKHV